MEKRYSQPHLKYSLSANEPHCYAMMAQGDHKVLRYWAAKTNKTMLEALHVLFTHGIKCFAEDHDGRLETLAKKFGLHH